MNSERIENVGYNRVFGHINIFSNESSSEGSSVRQRPTRKRRSIKGKSSTALERKKRKKREENSRSENHFGVSSLVSSRASLFLSCIAAVDNIGKGDDQESSAFSEFDILNDAIQDYLLNSDDDYYENTDIFHVIKPFLNSSRIARTDKIIQTRHNRCPLLRGPPRAETLLPRDKGLPLAPLCVVVDLDETLVSARREVIHLRPHVKELLDACHAEGCEVVVWSAAAPSHVNSVLRAVTKVLERRDWYHHVISRHRKWYREDNEEGVKDLSILGRPLNRVLILENNPKCIQKQPQHSVLVEDYVEPKIHDESLRLFASVLRRLVAGLKNSGGRATVDVPRLLAADAALINILLPPPQSASNVGNIFSKGLLYSPQKDLDCRCYGGRSLLSVGQNL